MTYTELIPTGGPAGGEGGGVDAAYVDDAVAAEAALRTSADAGKVAKGGDTMTGALVLPGDAAANLQATPLQQVNALIAAAVALLIGGADTAHDTLVELQTLLNTDESTAAALATTVAGKLAKSANLSDLPNAVTARANLGLGTAAVQDASAFEVAGAAAAAQAASQPLDSDLTALAALSTTAFGRALLVLVDAAALRTAAALGDSATKNTGTTAGTVAAGDDGRFTDTRTPTDASVTVAKLAADVIAAFVDVAGDTMTGSLLLPADAVTTGSARAARTDWVLARIQSGIDALVAGAPGALDTLNEIATQLANDESAVAALTTTVAGKVALATFTAANQILTGSGSGSAAALDVPASRIVGRSAAGSLDALTAAAVKTILAIAVGDVSGAEATANKGSASGYMGLDSGSRGAQSPKLHRTDHLPGGADKMWDSSVAASKPAASTLPIGFLWCEEDTNGGTWFKVEDVGGGTHGWVQRTPGVTAPAGTVLGTPAAVSTLIDLMALGVTNTAATDLGVSLVVPTTTQNFDIIWTIPLILGLTGSAAANTVLNVGIFETDSANTVSAGGTGYVPFAQGSDTTSRRRIAALQIITHHVAADSNKTYKLRSQYDAAIPASWSQVRINPAGLALAQVGGYAITRGT